MHGIDTVSSRIVLAILGALTATAGAADRVWIDDTGGGDGISFGQALNWLPAAVPGPFDRAIFNGLGGTVDLDGGATTTVLGVDVTGGSSVVLDSPVGMILTGEPTDRALYVGPGALFRPIGAYELEDDILVDGGTLNVSAAGTQFLVDGKLSGNAGSLVIVKSGAEVAPPASGAMNVVVASSTADATMRVTGAGSRVTCGWFLLGSNPSFSGVARLDVEDGGAVDVLPDATFDGLLEVGDGTEVNVTDGAVVCTSLLVETTGQVNFGTGSLTVDGGPMTLPNGFVVDGTDALTPGLLRLEGRADGTVPNALTVGSAADSYGRLELDFDSSLVTTGAGVGSDLRVGDFGAGEVLVDQGSLLQFADDVLIANTTDSTGDVTVQGAFLADGGSRSRLLAVGSSGAEIRVGRSGTGMLSILDGGLAVSGGDTFITGETYPSDGTVVVEGTSPLGHRSELLVGNDLRISALPDGTAFGTGTLNINADGLVEVTGTTYLGGHGTLHVDGGELVTTAMHVFPFSTIGDIDLDDGAIVINGGTLEFPPISEILADGAQDEDLFTWTLQNGASADGTYYLHVGEYRRGALEVLSGSDLAAEGGTVAYESASEGTLTVSGIGSSMTLDGTLSIGRRGEGTVVVSDTAHLDAAVLRLSQEFGTATLLVDNGNVGVDTLDLSIGYLGGSAVVELTNASVLNADASMDLQSTVARVILDDTSRATVGSLGHDGTLEFRLREFTPMLVAPALLEVESTVTLDGPVDITLDPAFVPVANMEWSLVFAPQINGTPTITLPTYPATTFVTVQTATSLHVRVEPEHPGDIDFDGMVGFSDLLAVIGAWGPCPPAPLACGADVDGDGVVGFSDILAIIGGWG